VKRTIAFLGGIATLGGAVFLGSRLWAQQPVRPTYNPQVAPVTAPTCKVAVYNLQLVLKTYSKFIALKADMQRAGEGYRKPYEDMAAEMKKLEADAQKATGEQREFLVKKGKDLQRKMQDMQEEAQGRLQKMYSDRLVAIYREVEDAAGRFARARGIELVMHFNDGDATEKYLPAFFPRRMASSACMPVYTAPGVDITQELIATLNANVGSVGAASPTQGAPIRR
jgi:Skp family chaperone for outer membrane proteins